MHIFIPHLHTPNHIITTHLFFNSETSIVWWAILRKVIFYIRKEVTANTLSSQSLKMAVPIQQHYSIITQWWIWARCYFFSAANLTFEVNQKFGVQVECQLIPHLWNECGTPSHCHSHCHSRQIGSLPHVWRTYTLDHNQDMHHSWNTKCMCDVLQCKHFKLQ
jgi:hypothetical protein